MISISYIRKRVMEKHKYGIAKGNTLSSSPLLTNRGFIVGMGSVFNITGKYFEYNYSKNAQCADFKAIKRDWEIVGQNLSGAIQKLTEVY